MRFQPSRSASIQKLFPFKGSTFLRRSAAGLILAMFVLLATTFRATGATIIYVDASASGAGTGSSWTNAYTMLQDALAAAASGDQIWVAAGVYYPDEGGGMTNNDRTATFTMIDGVEMYGGFAGTETTLGQRDWTTNVTVLSGDIEQNDTTDPNGIVTDVANIDGSNAYHVMTGGGTDSSAVLDGFTVTAGNANGSDPDYKGGGIYNYSSSPTLTNVTFSGNQAVIGAGMYSKFSSPTLTNVTFSGNQAQNGGGMVNWNSSNPTLTNVTFSGNQAPYGGGMLNDDSSPTLTNVTFSGNHADFDGAGMYNTGSSPTLTNVTFTDNQAQNGGGMYNLNSSNPTLTNVTFSGNQAPYGGGILNWSSNPTLTNVTFSGNQAPYGGGILNWSSNPTLTNVTFSGNHADFDGAGMFNSNSSPTLTNVTFSGNLAQNSGGGMYNASSNPTLANTILWNNQAGVVGNQIYNIDSIPVISYSDIQGSGGSGAGWDTALGTDGGNNLDADPLFVTPVDPSTAPTAAGDLHLQAGSPAVDAGDNGVCPATDLDGNLRPIDGDLDGIAVCDMGAFELLIRLFLPLIQR